MITFLKECAKEAGAILLSYQEKGYNVKTKADKSFVSDADIASQEYIIKKIEKYFPDSFIIAEESGLNNLKKSEKELTWIIDPLDGTTNFLHNFPFYAVSIGVMQNNSLIAGVVFNPATEELFHAEKNKGAYLNNSRLKVSETKTLSESLLITGFYYHEGDILKKQIKKFEKAQEITKAVRRLGAASLDICYVAKGISDGFWEDGLSVWDVAAGTIILSESGGAFTDLEGNDGDIFGKTFLYSNKIIHNDLLKILK